MHVRSTKALWTGHLRASTSTFHLPRTLQLGASQSRPEEHFLGRRFSSRAFAWRPFLHLDISSTSQPRRTFILFQAIPFSRPPALGLPATGTGTGTQQTPPRQGLDTQRHLRTFRTTHPHSLRIRLAWSKFDFIWVDSIRLKGLPGGHGLHTPPQAPHTPPRMPATAWSTINVLGDAQITRIYI